MFNNDTMFIVMSPNRECLYAFSEDGLRQFAYDTVMGHGETFSNVFMIMASLRVSGYSVWVNSNVYRSVH